jgi:hypothetical protein
MELRAIIPIAAAAFILAACHAAPDSNPTLPASALPAATLRDRPSTAARPQLFVYGDAFTSHLPNTMLEYPAGATGSDAPLRTSSLRRGPIWAGATGDFWTAPFAHRWMEQYDATGKGIARITASTGNAFLAGAVDPEGNVYTVVYKNNGSCLNPSVNVYSADKLRKIARAFATAGPCPSAIAADSAGDVFLAYRLDRYGRASVSKYGPGAKGPSARPISTFGISSAEIIGIAVNSEDTVFVQSWGTLYEYPRDAPGRQALPGIVIGRFALDPHDNLYISSYGVIYEYAPGSTTAMNTLALAGSGIGTVYRIAAGP